MKSKITRGKGFRGALDYAFDVGKDATHDKDAELIGGNMGGENPRELAHEFGAVRAIRPDVEKPVWHSSLRCPAGETPTDEKWNAIAKDYMQGLGFDTEKTPYCIVRHKDNHIHIIASRINLDGGLYLGKNEHLKATRLTQELEKAHGLTLTKGPEYTIDQDGKERVKMPDRKKPTGKELKMQARTGELSPKAKLQNIIDEAVKDKPTPEEYEERLKKAGVEWRKGSAGYSYSIDGHAFKGSQLGAAYKGEKFKDRLDHGPEVAPQVIKNEINDMTRSWLESEKAYADAVKGELREVLGELRDQKKEVYDRLKDINDAEAEDRAGKITGNEGRGFGPTAELLWKIAGWIDKIVPDFDAANRRLAREALRKELDEINKQMEPIKEQLKDNRLQLQEIKKEIREIDLSTRTAHTPEEKAAHDAYQEKLKAVHYERVDKPFYDRKAALSADYDKQWERLGTLQRQYRPLADEHDKVLKMGQMERLLHGYTPGRVADLDRRAKEAEKIYREVSDQCHKTAAEHNAMNSRNPDYYVNDAQRKEMAEEARKRLTPEQQRNLTDYRRIYSNQIDKQNKDREQAPQRQREQQKERGKGKGKGKER